MATARRQPLSDIVAAAVNSPRARPKSGKLARRGPPPALVLEPELEQLDEQVGGQPDGQPDGQLGQGDGEQLQLDEQLNQEQSGLALLIADRCDGLEDDLRCSLVDRPTGY